MCLCVPAVARAATRTPYGRSLFPLWRFWNRLRRRIGEKAVQQLASNRGSDYRGASVSQAKRARSSAGEHFLDMEGVTGSIPVAPTIQSGDRPAWQIGHQRARLLGDGSVFRLAGFWSFRVPGDCLRARLRRLDARPTARVGRGGYIRSAVRSVLVLLSQLGGYSSPQARATALQPQCRLSPGRFQNTVQPARGNMLRYAPAFSNVC